MKKHHKLLLILLFAISLFVVAFVLFCYLGTPKIIRYVVSKGINTLEEKYDIKIVIEDIQFYGLNIRIKGSCIIKDTSYSINQINFNLLKQELELTDFMCIKNHFKFAQIEKASASLNILPLFKSTLEIKKIDIRNPKIYLELDSKDKLILPDYQIGNEYEQNKTSSKFKFLLPHIDISKGYLVLPSSVGINIEDIDIKAACDVSYEQQYFMIDLRKTKLRYGLQVFPLKSLNLEAYSEESKLTLKRFKLESIFANIDMTGDYNFNKDPSTMEINLNGDLSLQNIGNTFLSEGAFHGFAKFNAQIKGISSCPDISAWIKISDGYMKDIKVSDAYIPFQLINKGFEENIRNYQLQVLKGSLMISDIAKSWECNLPAIDIDLMLQYPFESSVGSINLKKPVFSINEYKYVNDSLLADLKFNRQGMEIPSAKIRYKKRVSSFNGKIFYDNDLRYSFSYDLKPDPEYTFKIKEDISIHGDFHIKGNIQGEKDKLKTEGSVVASEIYIIDEKITHTNFNYIVTDKSIDIEKIDIQLHEGNITGNFNFIPGLTPVYSGEFHLDSIDISCFNTLQINQYIPSGMLSGYLSFYSKDFEPENSKLDLNMKISEGGISDKKRYYPVDIKTDVDFDSGNLQIHQLYAKLFGMDAEVKGKSDMKGTLDLEYRFDSNNLDAIGRIFNLPIEKGFLSINGSAAGSWNLPTVDMNIRADSLKSDNLMVQHFAGTFKGEKGSYKLKDTEIILNNFKSKFSGNLEFPLQGGVIEYSNLSLHGDLKTEGIKNDNPLMDDLSISFIYTKDDLKFRLSSMDEKLGCIFTKNNIEGSFSSELKVRDFEIIEYLKGFVGSNKVGAINSIIISLDSNASGIMDKPKSVQGHGKIDKIIISNPYFVLTNKLPIIIDFTSLNFFIPDFEFFTNSSSISGMVRIDDYEKFTARIEGNISLDEVSKMDFIDSTFGGLAKIEADVTGTINAPVLNGKLQIENGTYLFGTIGQNFSGITGTLVLRNNNISIDKLDCITGSGKLGIKGEFDIKKLLYDIDCKMDNINILYPEGLTSTVNGRINLKGSSESALLSGVVNPSYMKYSRSIRMEELLLIFKKQREEIVDKSEKQFPINFAIRLQAPGNIWFDSNIAKVESELKVYLQGSSTNPSLLGRISLLGGYFSLKELGLEYAKFDVESGLIDFINPSEINPSCDIICMSTFDAAKIYLYLAGPANDLNLRFESEPALDDYSIFYLLRTGSLPGKSVESPNINLSSAADLILGNLKDTILETFENTFPVDETEVEPIISDSERSGGVRFTTSKRVDKLKVTYSVTIGTMEEDRVYVEYKLNDMFFLTGEKNEEGGLGSGVKFRISF